MPDTTATIVAGVFARFYRRAVAAGSPEDQYVIPIEDKVIASSYRAATFRTPGRAVAGNAPLLCVWNGNTAGSGLFVDVTHMTADVSQTVAKAVTVIPVIIRVARFTAAPTGGTALTKMLDDTSGTSAAAVTVTGDASADGTASATALGATSVGTYAQEYSSRLVTAAGYEVADQSVFLAAGAITLQPQQGLMVLRAGAVAGSDPITDMWLSNVRVREFTRP